MSEKTPDDNNNNNPALRQVASTPIMLTPSNLPRTPSVTTAYAFHASIYDVLIDKSNETKPVVYYILQMTGELVGSGAECVEWTVSRRYSSFVQLKTELAVIGFSELPPLPPKTWFMDRLNTGLIEKRKIELTNFVNAIIRNRELFKTRLVRYFLKTSDFFKKRSASSIRRSNAYRGSRAESIEEEEEEGKENGPPSSAGTSSNRISRSSRLGQTVSLIPSPSALSARNPDQSREVYTTLRAVSFDNNGVDIDARWGDPVTYASPNNSSSSGGDSSITSWMPRQIRLQMENEKVFLTIDPDKFTETELLNVDGVWIEVDSNSIATTSLNGAKIKLLIQRERLRSFSNSGSSLNDNNGKGNLSMMPSMFLLVIIPLSLSYLILFTEYNSNIVLMISGFVILFSLYILKDMLHGMPEKSSQSGSNNNNIGNEVLRTLITFIDCELSSSRSNNDNNNVEEDISSQTVASPRAGSEIQESKVYMNHSGTWIVDANRSKTTYEPMLIALGISWPLRMLVRSLKTEMRVKHTFTHINRRDHFQNGGKPVAKDKDNHIFPLNGKTYFKRDEKNEDVYVTHTFEPDNGGCIQSITINKTQNIKIVDRQRLIDNGRALHHTIKTWGKDTRADDPAICDVIKTRTTRPIEGAFDDNDDGTKTYNPPEGWVLVEDDDEEK